MANNNLVVNPMLWYVCKFCGRAMQLASSLVNHKKQEHSQELRAERKKSKKKKHNESYKEKEGHSSSHLSKSFENPPDISKEDTAKSSSPVDTGRTVSLVGADPPSVAAAAIDHVSKGGVQLATPDDVITAKVLPENPLLNVADVSSAKTKEINRPEESLPDKTAPTSSLPNLNPSKTVVTTAKHIPEPLVPPVLEKLTEKPLRVQVEKTNILVKAVPEAEVVENLKEKVVEQQPVILKLSGIHNSIRKVSKSFRCTFCERIFKNAGACAMHTKTHTGKDPYKCRVCFVGFRRKDDWKNHELTHVNHRCSVCQQIFSSPEACSEHEATHSTVVSKTTEKSATMKSENTVKCIRIKRGRKKRKTLYSFPKPHKCRVCKKSFATLKNLEIHRAREHPLPSQYMCRFCSKIFATSNTCRIHEYIHTGETPYDCLYCDLSFSTSGRRITHMKSQHPREYAASSRFHRDSKPEEIRLSPKSKKHVTNKATSSSNPQTPVVDPPQESLKFIFRIGRGRTRKNKNISILPSNTRKINLTSANSQSTENIDPDPAVYKFPCSHCGKRFRANYKRKSHELIHTGVKPYPCTVCGKRFRLSDTLRTHMRSHTGERPYKCEVCSKSFSEASTLKQHVLIHTGEKPYKCNQCSAAFRYNSSLKSHTAKRHVVNVPTKNTMLHKVRNVSVVRPTTRKVDEAKTKLAANENSSEPIRAENYRDIIHQEVSSGLLHYTCTLCRKVFWYRNEAEAHVRNAHHEA